jgi:predicted nucleic acid-binding protein
MASITWEADVAEVCQDIGAHDRLVAATAITAGWRVGAANLRHFDRIAGLEILAVTFTG